jgi:DNA-binding XRE family transcriptional regulator
MEKMKLYTFDEVLDMQIGKKGTPERDKYDDKMEAFLVGEAIRQTREKKKLTQEQLGELLGVQKAQISKIENGRNITLSTLSRVFRALGVTVKLDLGSIGSVTL